MSTSGQRKCAKWKNSKISWRCYFFSVKNEKILNLDIRLEKYEDEDLSVTSFGTFDDVHHRLYWGGESLEIMIGILNQSINQ